MSVDVTAKDGVVRVTINRPEVMNAVDPKTEAELIATWEAIERDRSVRVVVLTGAGERAFSAGADVKGASGTGAAVTGLEYWAAPRPGGFGGISLRTTLDVPVIARVNGHALGGGFEMVLGCDIVIAAAHATMGLPEPRLGRLPLDGGMVLLPRLIPKKLAAGMLFSARRVKAAEARALGLVNEVVPAAELDAAVDRWVADILASAPLSVRAIKQSLNRTGHMTALEAQAVRLPALIEALASKDQDEGVTAFREKRPPVWKGE